MLLLRSAVFNLMFYALLIGMLVAGIPLMLAPERVVKSYARLWGRLSVRLLAFICGTRVVYRGLEHVPAGGLIIAAKHQSFLDVLALLPIAPSFTYVMKHELSLIPLFGPLMRRAGMIAIDRSRGRHIMGDLNIKVARIVAAGHQLIIFPEGTRRPVGAEPSYKSGTAHLYVATGATCLPVALLSGLFWPRRGFLRRPGTLVVTILPPIAPGLNKSAFQARLQHDIEAASNTLLDEARAMRGGAE